MKEQEETEFDYLSEELEALRKRVVGQRITIRSLQAEKRDALTKLARFEQIEADKRHSLVVEREQIHAKKKAMCIPGAVLIDAYGKELVVDKVGPEGWVDTDGTRHDFRCIQLPPEASA